MIKYLKSISVFYLAILSFTILVTIYGAWLLYPFEVDHLKLVNQVIISKQELLKNFNHLLDYLTNPFHTKLSMPDFKSSKDGLHHFFQVKLIFHFVQLVFFMTIYPALFFFKYHLNAKSIYLYQKFFLSAIITPILIGMFGVFIGFDNFFTLFHQILFVGDSSWLFNPATDPIIWVLPEEFFLHCFIGFFVLYQGILVGLYLLAKR